MAQNLPSLDQDEDDVSYDVDSLFTNFPIQETIDYIVKEICFKNKLKPICSKINFTRLFKKACDEEHINFQQTFLQTIR